MLVCQFLKGFYLQLHNYTGASDWDKSFTLTCKDDKDTIVDTAIMTSESTRLHGYVVLTMFCKRGRRKAKDGRWKQNFRKNFVFWQWNCLCRFLECSDPVKIANPHANMLDLSSCVRSALADMCSSGRKPCSHPFVPCNIPHILFRASSRPGWYTPATNNKI